MTIIAVGKMTTKGLNDTMKHYLKQIKKLEVIEVKESTMEEEAVKIHKLLKKDDYIVTLEIEGEQLSSPALSLFLEEKKQYFGGRIVFIIGGSEGLHQSIKSISHKKISMSLMTFPHQIARVLLVEQLYRAQKISDKHPYHK